MGYGIKATVYINNNWLVESLNDSLKKTGGKVWVVCTPYEKEKIEGSLVEPLNSKLYFVTGAGNYISLLEHICCAEMSVCYVSQTLAEKIGIEGQRYIFSRLRNQGWCSGEIVYFSGSDLAKLQEG